MTKVSIGKLARVPTSLESSVRRTLAEYRRLGRSGLRVSNPILGGLHFGDSRYLPWILNADEALPLLKAAYDLGINTWDTANVYSNGESERIMGRALQKYDIPRRKVVLMTKCFRVVCDSEDHDPGSAVTMHHGIAEQAKEYVNQWGLSRSAIFSAVEASLERLQTPYIDVLQIHRYDESVNPEETMEALHDLVKSGKVRYLGASSMWTYQFATLQHIADRRGWTKFISMQNHYNLLYREEEREMNKYCVENGIGLIPWSPLASGRLARPCDEAKPSARARDCANGSIYESDGRNSDLVISRVQEIAERRGWPMSHVALAWLNRRVVAPVVGISSLARMHDVLAVRGKELTEAEEIYLEELYRPQEVQGHF